MQLALKRMGNRLTDFAGSNILQTHCLKCEGPSYLQRKDEQDLCIEFPTRFLSGMSRGGKRQYFFIM